ncbi:uncharacterized protein uimc1 isoform X2 [Gadus chalcogrammus]|uniref:uncharacterized protein uimc1 isoform X2 n=1 Tax=Gadus chalcogrammus TaxID=1042646 RepID=UPI0024C37AAD|nr:uncharacterized protein uimc1 isoform X2 [Gadus chalcogrammus]
MSPRKQVIKTSSALSSGGDGDCVEADDTDEEMFQEELPHSSTSLSRRRERVVKAKPKELSEEEMMDLALRLSEQEASIAAAKRQQEEEAMTEALKESMFSQTQPCASPPSQRYHGNTDPSPKLPSRRQLAYPATVPKNVSLAEELSVNNNPRGAGNLKHNMRKRKREDGVPVLERADLPQTQKICSQSSTLEPLCSQDFSSSQTDPCLLPKTFKPSSSASKLHVQLPRLSPGILKTCRTSGFVLCSQQSLTSTQTSLTSPSNSPTFPSSATHSDNVGYSKKPKFPKSADCSDPDVEVIGETDPRFNCPKSPVFGRVGSTKALDNTSTAPKSPVFGRVGSTKALDNTSTAPKSPVFGRVGSRKALDNTSTAPKSPVFGMVESTRALDNRCIAAKSPVFARVESTKASDYENQIAASVTSQKSLPTCDDDKFPEGLKFSKLSRFKRPIHFASNTLSKGLKFPKSPASTGKGEAKDLLRDGCSVRTEHCGTSPLFVKSRKVSGETRPDFREESPRFGKTSLPKTGSGRSSPVLGRTSPVFGRTSPVFGSTRTERSSILPATIGQESSSQDSYSAISNKESRQPRQCLQKTNGLNHKDAESESTSRDHVGKPTTAALAGKEKPTKKDEESIPEIMKMTSDMTLHWSDSEEDLEQSEGSPSPVFPEERRPRQAEPPTCSPEHSGSAPSATSSHSPKRLRLNPVPAVVFLEAAGSDTSTSCPRVPQSGPGPSHPQEPSSRVPAPPLGPGGEPLVQYYWGVPFCPQGLDPDRYTQVILAQMEVYEKSLKNAQRGLLRKAEWGAGITPKPEEPLEDSPELIPTISLRRPGLRSRRRAAGVKPSEEEEEDEDEDEGGREEDVKRKGVEPVEEAEEDLDVVGCDMCPETQLSGDETQVLEVGTDAADETQPDSPSLLQIQSLPRSWEGEGEGEEEEEETHPQDPNKKEEEAEEDAGGDCEQPAVMSPSREQAPLSGKEEEEEETQGAVGVEERKEAGPEAGLEAASSVDCPMCQSAFPVSEIEMHAAFCDGEQEVVESPVEDSPGSHRPSKRRALKSLATEDRGDGDPSGHAPAPQGRERCYVCHKSVPLAEYARHTESCIQRQRAHTASPGDLLSALENTERRHPGGPSVSKLPTAVIDLSNSNDDDDDESEEGGSGQPSTFKVSDSPIRAFTSISEASDCLVDFRRQLAPREPSQRSRGRRGGRGGGGRGGGGGFKRKFKRR